MEHFVSRPYNDESVLPDGNLEPKSPPPEPNDDLLPPGASFSDQHQQLSYPDAEFPFRPGSGVVHASWLGETASATDFDCGYSDCASTARDAVSSYYTDGGSAAGNSSLGEGMTPHGAYLEGHHAGDPYSATRNHEYEEGATTCTSYTCTPHGGLPSSPYGDTLPSSHYGDTHRSDAYTPHSTSFGGDSDAERGYAVEGDEEGDDEGAGGHEEEEGHARGGGGANAKYSTTLAAVGTLSPSVAEHGMVVIAASTGEHGLPLSQPPPLPGGDGISVDLPGQSSLFPCQSHRSSAYQTPAPRLGVGGYPASGSCFTGGATDRGRPSSSAGAYGVGRRWGSRAAPSTLLGSLTRRVVPLMTNTQNDAVSEAHDVWLDVSSYAGPPKRQAQKREPLYTSSKMSNKERRAEIERLSQLRRAKMNRLGASGALVAKSTDKTGKEKDRPTKKKSAVGAVETGLVYALTCPQGKKYVGKTLRTLTQRNNTVPVSGLRLIREAIRKNGGIKQFKTEVLVCCAATAVDANEQLYIERLGTTHPKGYNEETSRSKEAIQVDRRASKETVGMTATLYSGASGGNKAVPAAGGKGADAAGAETEEVEAPDKECKAGRKEGRAWLDAAMGGRVDEMTSMLLLEPTILHFKGQGLGQSALHWSCAKGHAKAVRFLIDKGANIESMNNNKSRPLHAAAASGSMECVNMLISAGCKVDRLDGDGRSCEKIALARGHNALGKLLGQKHNAVTEARDKAANAANAAAYAAAAKDRKDIIPIVSPVEEVIAQGLVSLAIAGDIISEGSPEQVAAADPENDADAAYIKKNTELEAQLGDVERKLRLDRLYASRPPTKTKARVYF